jgi:hypothetical protein
MACTTCPATRPYELTPDGREVNDLDIGIDFVPVIHVPNTPSGSKHFGRSLLLSVAQLLDDIGFADSDLAASSEFVGNTPVVTTGGTGGRRVGPRPGRAVEHADRRRREAARHVERADRADRLRRAPAVAAVDQLADRGGAARPGRAERGPVRVRARARVRADPVADLEDAAGPQAQAPADPEVRDAARAGRRGAAGRSDATRGDHLGPYLPADVQAEIDRVEKLLRRTRSASRRVCRC